MKFILAYLLHYANRDILHPRDEEFYAIKKRLLRRYGKLVKYDFQHIQKECWDCNGTGIFRCGWKMPETCWSCLRTGKYDDFYVLLEKYKLGKFYFHNPIHRVSGPLNFYGKEIIEGKIRHQIPKYRLGEEFCFWLFLFYDFKTFINIIGKIKFCGNVRLPMLMLSNLIWKIKGLRIGTSYVDVRTNESINFPAHVNEDDLPF